MASIVNFFVSIFQARSLASDEEWLIEQEQVAEVKRMEEGRSEVFSSQQANFNKNDTIITDGCRRRRCTCDEKVRR